MFLCRDPNLQATLEIYNQAAEALDKAHEMSAEALEQVERKATPKPAWFVLGGGRHLCGGLDRRSPPELGLACSAPSPRGCLRSVNP